MANEVVIANSYIQNKINNHMEWNMLASFTKEQQKAIREQLFYAGIRLSRVFSVANDGIKAEFFIATDC